MRARHFGSSTWVDVRRSEVETFKRSWPCSGLPDRGLSFCFYKNGDLVDMWPSNLDGAGLVALLQDAQRFARKRGFIT